SRARAIILVISSPPGGRNAAPKTAAVILVLVSVESIAICPLSVVVPPSHRLDRKRSLSPPAADSAARRHRLAAPRCFRAPSRRSELAHPGCYRSSRRRVSGGATMRAQDAEDRSARRLL